MNEGGRRDVWEERAELLARLDDDLAVGRHPLFGHGRGKEGLGRFAAATFRAIRDAGHAGIGMDDLFRKTFYSETSIRKHLAGLERHGLIECVNEERWRRTAVPLPSVDTTTSD